MDFLYKTKENRMSRCTLERAEFVMMSKSEYEELQKSIEELKRVVRERSNAERKIQPKKQRSGYILTGYDSADYRMSFSGKSYSYKSRRLLLETPYPITMSYPEAYSAAVEDLKILAGTFGAFDCISDDTIPTEDFLKDLYSPESEKYLITTGLEAKNNLWAIRIYANFTPQIPTDMIKNS